MLRHGSRIVWYEGIAFSFIIMISWCDELFGFSNWLTGGGSSLDWHEALVESAIVLLVGIPAMILTHRLSQRLIYLEGFLRICAWCRKVNHEDQWVSFEDYATKKLDTKTSHGICPECYRKTASEIDALGGPAAENINTR